MANVKRRIEVGVRLNPSDSDTTSELGDLQSLSATNKTVLNNGTSSSPIVTEAHQANLTNKDSITSSSGASLILDSLGTSVNLRVNGTNSAVFTSGQAMFQAGSASLPGLTFTGDSNTGIYASTTDTLSFTTGGTNRLTIASDGIVTVSNRVRVGAGTLALPGLAFAGDTDTGIYSPTLTNDMSFVAGGAAQMAVDTNGVRFTNPSGDSFYTANGSNSPFVRWNAVSGSWSRQFNQVRQSDTTSVLSSFGVNGSTNTFNYWFFNSTSAGTSSSADWLRFSSTGIKTLDGTATDPAYSFIDDTDTGIYSASANTLNFTTAGTQAANFDSSGNFHTLAQHLVKNGSISSPGLAFEGSTTTGLYQPSSNAIGFATNGALRGLFASSGEFRLYGLTSGYIGLQASSTTTSYNISFPSSQGTSNTFLRNDGSGNLTWGSPTGSGGDIVNGGNTFGAAVTIGTNDNFALNLETNNTTNLTITTGGQVQVNGNTTSSAPAYSFINDPDSGIYAASNIVSIATSGTQRVAVNTTSLLVPDGSTSAVGVGFLSEANTGLYRQASGNIGIVTNGTERVRVPATGGLNVFGTSSGYVGIKAAAATTSYDLTLPAAAPTANGQTITFTTAGVASFAAAPTPVYTAPVVTTYLSGSGTYNTPANTLYLRVRMVGGGGGGAGSGTSGGGGTAGNGGNTTFGTTLLVANGGSGATATAGTNNGGDGGAASLGTGPTGIALTGGSGQGNAVFATGQFHPGGNGGASAFGGAGGGASANTGANPGKSAAANSGSGGGGAGGNSASTFYCGAGGGAGGFVDAVIASPSSTYSYAVGAAGTAGTAGSGSGAAAGGAGAAGMIEVTAYFQ